MFDNSNLQPKLTCLRATINVSSAFLFCTVFSACCVTLHAEPPVAPPAAPPVATRLFIDQHCVSCHEGEEAEAGLDLKALSFDLADAKAAERWVRIYDRVHDGEMPPKDADKVDAQLAAEFLKSTSDWI